MAIAATYVSTSSFTVVGDRAAEFNVGRRTRCVCSGSYDYGTVVSGIYSSPDTTITLTEDSDDLNIGLTAVEYGVKADGNGTGSLPEHTHCCEEGDGGEIAYSHWASKHIFLDENYANALGKPSDTNHGLFRGYIMPIWTTPTNQYEELLFRMRVPHRWDGVTKPWFVAMTAPSATEDVDDTYKFQIEWQSSDVGSIILDTIQETLTCEVTLVTGQNAAWFAHIIQFELDATTIVSGQNLQLRLRRIASTTEVSANPVIFHWDTRWKRDKIGTESIQGY